MPLTTNEVFTLLSSILGLAIAFLAQVQELLQQHAAPEPAARDRREEPEPSTPGAATPTTTTIPETSASPPALSSPSAWRSTRTPNTQLLAEYRETGTCAHYWHNAGTPHLNNCPVCLAPRSRRCPPS